MGQGLGGQHWVQVGPVSELSAVMTEKKVLASSPQGPYDSTWSVQDKFSDRAA